MAEPAAMNWNGEGFDQMREAIINRFNCSEEEATARMQATWNNAFQNLLEDPQPPPPIPPPTPPPADNQPPRNATASPDIDNNVMVGDTIPLTPLAFAIKKIKAKEYVDLWYFTTEGCKEASLTMPTAPVTLGVLDTETGMALQLVNDAKPSKRAIIDEHLTWEQLMTARHTLINLALQHGWSPQTLHALAEFYINLESLKAQGRNSRALILYHATVRRQWHAALKPGAMRFNISLINEKLLASLENQIRDHDHEVLQKQVALISSREVSGSWGGHRDRGRSAQRDRGRGRQRSSRSKSPRDRIPKQKFRRDSPETEAVSTRSVCPVCLGRGSHSIRQCQATHLWNDSEETRCSRTEEGRIIDKAGRILCTNWNQTVGCTQRFSRHIHECSGCGKSSHGAQRCPRAEKAPSAHAARS
ncbi:hypothetical protein BJ322DRAFT_1026297 [Thelephora terrestris]|uniref:Uncharacterized protein n=1 Tax=Thelephora terrestris TaxID=56493 RepID=A0A9P6LBM6_9AGAM|nr:hypothetical protein BJ322DRAFT_1026297 [Thelephora terrestris]